MEDTVEKIRFLGLEYLGLYYSLYEGIVVDNSDPQAQGRIKVKVPALGRDDPLEQYAYPVAPFAGDGMGIFFPPEVGELVWILFHGGNPSLPLYVGGWWKRNNVPPEACRSGAPKIRTIRTKEGHRIVFDDGAVSPGITIQTPKGVIIRLKNDEQSVEIISPSEVRIRSSTARVTAEEADVTASYVNLNGDVRVNAGGFFVAAIGDEVVDQHGRKAVIVGPPPPRSPAGRPRVR